MENKSQEVMPDNRRTGAEDDIELDYWSNEFGISREELMAVVKAGGTSAEAVAKYVQKMEFAA
jgi:hypothetical protein